MASASSFAPVRLHLPRPDTAVSPQALVSVNFSTNLGGSLTSPNRLQLMRKSVALTRQLSRFHRKSRSFSVRCDASSNGRVSWLIIDILLFFWGLNVVEWCDFVVGENRLRSRSSLRWRGKRLCRRRRRRRAISIR